MKLTSSPIAPGAHIELRDAVWRVQRVDATSTGSQAWRCVGISEIVRDQEALFLEEYEPEVRVLDPRETRLERDMSSQHRAGLLYMESLLRDVPPQSDGLYVGHRAAMDVLGFQLEPAWMALSKPRQRILIADAVGLGKTLEAGILLSELIRRGRARRILVATTKSMLTQFQKEMWARFSIPLVRLDSIGLARIRAEIPTHHNPFYHFDKTIISIDTLKQHNWFRRHVEGARWDVVVIDEAHNVASRGSRESQRAGIAAKLARNCDSMILLSATPHDGKPESFASLMNLLDPTAIADPSNYTQEDIRGLYVRRFKRDVQDQLAEHIPEPEIMEAHAAASVPEEAAFERLTGLELEILDEGAAGGILFRTGLTKALFSSPRACLSQLRAPLRRQRIGGALPEDVRKELLDPKETTTSKALDRAAGHLGSSPEGHDLRALGDLARAIEAITPGSFSKYQKLLETLERIGWKAHGRSDDRLVIFTERLETLDFLAEHLTADLGLRKGEWEVLHGGSDVEQQRIVEEFGKERSAVRLLLASDVASEGLNLHYLCHRLIHFDMPWSLMVFQQRNGRIDRYGQTVTPQIVYLQTDSQNPVIQGDVRILTVLREKAEQAEKNIGDPSAFMGVFNVEDEERITAQAIQSGTSAEELASRFDAKVKDPFALLLEEAAHDGPARTAPTRTPLSLFASDFEYFVAGIENLRETTNLEATVQRDQRLVELKWPEDLKRRFAKLPAEVRPDDGVVLLTADPARMQRSLADARREESTWPQHHYLWANSPALSWLSDRVRAAFGRHTAPVLMVPAVGGPRDAAVVVSGLLPNRRGQALVHRWYVARFARGQFTEVEPFEAFLTASGLGRASIPNDGSAVDEQALARLLPAAIEAVERRVLTDRDQFRAALGPRLNEELERLDRLRGRQLTFIEERFGGQADPRSTHRRRQELRRVRNLFDDYQVWIREAMTTADKPFLQVVAVLVGTAS